MIGKKKRKRNYKEMKEEVLSLFKQHGRMRPYEVLRMANLTTIRKNEICADLEKAGVIRVEKIDKYHYEYVLRDDMYA